MLYFRLKAIFVLQFLPKIVDVDDSASNEYRDSSVVRRKNLYVYVVFINSGSANLAYLLAAIHVF